MYIEEIAKKIEGFFVREGTKLIFLGMIQFLERKI